MRKRVCGPMPYVVFSLLAACSGESADEAARRTFLALDQSLAKTLNLAFQGYNVATTSSVAPQTTDGNHGGTLTIQGTVDKSSATKTMQLTVLMVGYNDGDVLYNDSGDTVHVVFDTLPDATPTLDLMLGVTSFNGTLTPNANMTGVYQLRGDHTGTLTIDVSIAGYVMAGNGNEVLRAPGTTQITGTATNSDGGVFDINVTR